MDGLLHHFNGVSMLVSLDLQSNSTNKIKYEDVLKIAYGCSILVVEVSLTS